MSYNLRIDPKSSASGRFIRRVYTTLIKAAINQQRQYGEGYSQQDVAKKLEVDKATISRLMRGTENITLRRLAEVSWALDLLPEISFRDLRATEVTQKNDRAVASVPDTLRMRVGRAANVSGASGSTVMITNSDRSLPLTQTRAEDDDLAFQAPAWDVTQPTKVRADAIPD